MLKKETVFYKKKMEFLMEKIKQQKKTHLKKIIL